MFTFIGLVLLILSAYFCYKTSILINKKEDLKVFSIKSLIKEKLFLRNILISTSSTLLGLAIMVFSYVIKEKIEIDFIHYFMIILGILLITVLFTYLFLLSDVRLYRKVLELPIKINKTAFSLLIILLFILSCLLFMQGIGKYLYYPLFNQIHFDTWVVELLRYNDRVSGGLRVTFYGILIISGALIVYLVCDYKFYIKYGQHGMLEDLLMVAFPAGLIGARLWYCLILEPDQFLANPIEILYVWDGGLAIMGGAILGIAVGVTYVITRKKNISVLFAIDTIVPCILIAQAVGRWGNFFNHEVFGKVADASSWSFLPTFILNQMSTSFSDGLANGSQIYVPLFFIESLTNLAGYFIITRVFGGLLKKYMKPGVLGSLYLVWYGLTRAILEPLRYGEFQYNQSWYSSFILIGVGLLLIGFIYLMNYIIKKRKTLETK